MAREGGQRLFVVADRLSLRALLLGDETELVERVRVRRLAIQRLFEERSRRVEIAGREARDADAVESSRPMTRRGQQPAKHQLACGGVSLPHKRLRAFEDGLRVLVVHRL